MQNLHKVPKERFVPELTDIEKRGIVYLYRVGYRWFKRSRTQREGRGMLFDVSTYSSGRTPYREMPVRDYAVYTQPNDVLYFNPDWIIT